MKVICTAKTKVYDALGNVESWRYISKGDVCEMDEQLLKTMQHKISYPTSKGQRTAYIRDIANFTLG